MSERRVEMTVWMCDGCEHNEEITPRCALPKEQWYVLNRCRDSEFKQRHFCSIACLEKWAGVQRPEE